MAKKFVKVNGLSKVFNITGSTYNVSTVKSGITAVDDYSILFIQASNDDDNKWAGQFNLQQNNMYIWTQGDLYSCNEGSISGSTGSSFVNVSVTNEDQYTKNLNVSLIFRGCSGATYGDDGVATAADVVNYFDDELEPFVDAIIQLDEDIQGISGSMSEASSNDWETI